MTDYLVISTDDANTIVWAFHVDYVLVDNHLALLTHFDMLCKCKSSANDR